MSLNSALYKGLVMHHRFSPRVHKFHYRTFQWWIDLDEPKQLAKKHLFFGYNKFNLFSFYDKDHINGEQNNRTVKENIVTYLTENGVNWQGGKIFLLTNLRTFGYLFNPVSFYYCFDKQGAPFCAVAQVGNTYYEMKPFLLTDFNGKTFDLRIKKHFYVSPFTQLDDEFDFKLALPGEKLNIKIDDHRNGEKFFISTLSGERKAMTNRNILFSFLRFPFITLQVIFLIHWQALKLWLKKIPHQAKAANKHLQQDVLRKHKSLQEEIS